MRILNWCDVSEVIGTFKTWVGNIGFNIGPLKKLYDPLALYKPKNVTKIKFHGEMVMLSNTFMNNLLWLVAFIN